jgi:hypothetical protein
VDQGQRTSGVGDKGGVTAGECRSCAISRWIAGDSTRSVGGYVAEDIGEDVIVVSSRDFDGLVVMPRRHVSGLEELSVVHRAQVLAALQRATRSVLERNPGMTTTVLVMTDPPASEGHACYHVLPSGYAEPLLPTSP